MIDHKVKDMSRAMNLSIFAIALFGLAACGSDKAEDIAENKVADVVDLAVTPPDVSFKSDGELPGNTPATPGSPYRVSYRIIGTPVVGSPVTVDLRISSLRGPRTTDLNFRIRDESSMLFAESQPARIRLEAAANEAEFSQQVTVIPQREGRFYLNVSASFETEGGTVSTVTAIPIQVGTGSRELQDHGEVQLDEDGEAVRVLSND
jgi:hypothetical protein